MNTRTLFIVLGAALLLSSCREQAPAEINDIEKWQAVWIGAPWEGDSYVLEAEHPTPEFRQDITIKSKVRKATVYVCGLGLFEMTINGKRVGEDYYVPNETMYGTREPGYKYGSIKVDDHTFKNYRVM